METSRDDRDRVGALSAALAASESRFHNIIERNVDGILVVAPDGTIRYANPAAVRLLRRPRRELEGRSFGLPIVPGETTEIDLPLASGEVRVAELRVAETGWEGVTALLCTLRDVSERKALELQLRRKMDELAEADRRKDEFLAMLAHELRNPLAPIRNAVHILSHRAHDPEMVARTRELIDHEVRSLTRLVDDLLDVARITTGKIKLQTEPITLGSVVERAMRTARPQLATKLQSVRTSVPSVPIWIQADPIRIEQIVVNLLNNAVKYTDVDGTIHLEVRVEAEDAVVVVRDDGVGIEPEMLDRIFDLFEQADPTQDRALGGLGLGLTLGRRLARLHGGELAAHSDGRGRGSTFTLRIPLLREGPEREAGTAGHGRTRASRGRKVLIVDDNQALAASLRDLLKIWGHECRVVHNGHQALVVAREYCPEVVLLDIGLPTLDGHAVAAELGQSPGEPRPRLIAMSGYGRYREMSRARDSGFERYLVKPVDLDLLERILDGREPPPVDRGDSPRGGSSHSNI